MLFLVSPILHEAWLVLIVMFRIQLSQILLLQAQNLDVLQGMISHNFPDERI